MNIRHFQPGDEQVQATIYNMAAGKLPAFKPANSDEIARRYLAKDSDPSCKFYAVVDDKVVGYAVLNPNGRISYPWCLPGAEACQAKLLEAVLAGLRERRVANAWVAYRADWANVSDFFLNHQFKHVRDMVNYVGDVKNVSREGTSEWRIGPARPGDFVGLPHIDASADAADQHDFYWHNPYFTPEAVFAARDAKSNAPGGVGTAIVNPAYADPTKLDARMPCFRLGTIGTERERHKRINGMFSCSFTDVNAAAALLAEAVRRFEQAGIEKMASQAASDRPELIDFCDKYFERQGAFPIYGRTL